MFNGTHEVGRERVAYPAHLSYPAELDGGTHLGRARRIIAEAGSAGNYARSMSSQSYGHHLQWERAYDERVKSLMTSEPGYPYYGTNAGRPVLTEVFTPRLDRMVSDLLPQGGPGFPPDESLYDVNQVDEDLAQHLGDLRRFRREGKGQKAVTAMIAAMQRLTVLTGILGKTFPLKCTGLTIMADLPDNRGGHLVGIVDGNDVYGGPPPAGTLAFSDLSLEALIYRLIAQGRVGGGKAKRYRDLRDVLGLHRH